MPDELRAMQNVVLLPHIGSASVVTRNAMDQLVVSDARSEFRSDSKGHDGLGANGLVGDEWGTTGARDTPYEIFIASDAAPIKAETPANQP